MLRETRNDSGRLQLAFGFLFVFVAFFPGLTLFSGQVVKQFESFSLARSMALAGWNPYASSIPCDGGIRWVLELPIFAGIGGIFFQIFPEWPAIFPVLIYGLFLAGLFRFRTRLAPESSPWVWTAVAAAPVFLRFSTQYLPDPLAVALLLLGAGFFLERRRVPAVLLFMLAVSVKPTVLPSVLFFRWAFAPERDPGKLLPKSAAAWALREAAIAAALVAPFAAWSLSVKLLGIPSPMHEGGLLAIGRDWAILGERTYYSKFLNWTAFKGVGIPLFATAIYGALRVKEERIRRLAAWSIGIIPYWLVVRRLNVIHDYYSLSFFVPVAILGALVVERFLTGSRRARVVAYTILAVTIGQGLFTFIRAGAANPRRPVAERPIFCGLEFRSEKLMGIPTRETPAN